VTDILRRIIGIENRTAQEVFDIMSDRFRSAHRPVEQEAVEQLRFMAKNLRLPYDRMFDFHILAHERSEVADNIERLLAASPPSRALSLDEREKLHRRVMQSIESTWEEYGIEATDTMLIDLAALGALKILHPEGEANG